MGSRQRRRLSAPPHWLVPGAFVDYHSVIGGPVTHANRKVLDHPWQLGHGAWVVAIEGVSGGVAVEAVTPRTTGPRFSITTWEDCEGWHARLVPVRAEAAPFSDPPDEEKACVGHSRRLLETAVREAVAKWVRVWGHGKPRFGKEAARG